MSKFDFSPQNGNLGDIKVSLDASVVPQGRYDFNIYQKDGESAEIEFSSPEEVFIFSEVLKERATGLMDPERGETEALSYLLEEQEKLDELIRDERDVSWETVSAELNDVATALGQEVEELRNTTDWKWWSEKTGLREEEAKEELIDVFFFALSAANILGLSAGDILKLYQDKANTNRERVKGDY